MKKYMALLPIFILLSFVACNAPDKDVVAKENKEAPEEEHEDPNKVSLTDEQIKSVGIELGSIEEKQLTSALKANGVLKVPNQNKAIINSIYSGIIKSLLVQPGSPVSKGQTIATVSNPAFIQAQSEYLSINAKISLAELEVKRQRELNAGNAGALKNLQSAETELSTLRTARSTYAQQIQLMGVNPSSLRSGKLVSVLAVRSPINGVVSEVKVQMGSYIDVSTTVAEVVDNSQLHLDLFVYEKDLPYLKNNQLIHFTLTNNPGKEYDAQVYSLGSSFEEGSKAVSVHAKVQGDKTGLIDGMTITAAISLDKHASPAVPSEAIVNVAGQDFIFVHVGSNAANKDSLTHKEESKEAEQKEQAGQVFEKIPVAKGTTDVGYTAITLLKEIPPASKIVVKGAFFVLAKMTNAGGHEH